MQHVNRLCSEKLLTISNLKNTVENHKELKLETAKEQQPYLMLA